VFTDVFFQYHVLPKTNLGFYTLSFSDEKTAQDTLNILEQTPFTLIADRTIKQMLLSDMGILLDKESTIRRLFSYRDEPFPIRLLTLLRAFFFSNQTIIPDVRFSDSIYSLSQAFGFGNSIEKTYVINSETKLLTSSSHFDGTVDIEDFKEKIISSFASGEKTIYLIIKRTDEMGVDIQSLNTGLSNIYASPVTITFSKTLQGNGNIATLSGSQIRQMTAVAFDSATDQLTVAVDENEFTTVFNNVSDSQQRSTLKTSLQSLLIDRFNGSSVEALTIGEIFPNTNGQKAQKYIEIDISQQRMYLFNNSNLVNTYRVSTGKNYPTPTGEFSIRLKAPNAYSGIFHVYMPYWMEFYFDPKIHATMGIHELPYWWENGEKKTRPRDFIGSPNTGGCVALDIGQAKEVYEFGEIGMPVYIFP